MGWKIIIAVCLKLYITIQDAVHTNDVWIETVGRVEKNPKSSSSGCVQRCLEKPMKLRLQKH